MRAHNTEIATTHTHTHCDNVVMGYNMSYDIQTHIHTHTHLLYSQTVLPEAAVQRVLSQNRPCLLLLYLEGFNNNAACIISWLSTHTYTHTHTHLGRIGAIRFQDIPILQSLCALVTKSKGFGVRVCRINISPGTFQPLRPEISHRHCYAGSCSAVHTLSWVCCLRRGPR
jgi:hypothetical protein